MRDLTNEIYNKVKTAVLALYGGAKVTKQYQSTNTSFPCVTILDLNSPELSHTLDYQERRSRPAWQIDIYANGSTGEIVAKQIRDVIIPVFEDEYHMRRLEAHPQTNAADTTIYRYLLRYDCILNEDTGVVGS